MQSSDREAVRGSCDGSSGTGQDGRRHAYERSWEHDGIRVIECRDCGFKHQDPIPSLAWVEEFYRTTYFQKVVPDWTEKQLADRVFMETVYRDKIETLEELLPRSARRILDVGCGNGLFLAYCRGRGWTTIGIEPSPAGGYARDTLGLDVIGEMYEAATLPHDKRVDAVHVAGFLEHVRDPRALIRKCREFLAPGGVLCIDHGLDFNPFQLTAVESRGVPRWWIRPEHISYFDMDELSRFLEREGFRVLRTLSDFPIDAFLLMGIDYVSEPELGQLAHQYRVRFEQALVLTGRDELRRRLCQALASVGVARSVYVFARPKDGH